MAPVDHHTEENMTCVSLPPPPLLWSFAPHSPCLRPSRRLDHRVSMFKRAYDSGFAFAHSLFCGPPAGSS